MDLIYYCRRINVFTSSEKLENIDENYIIPLICINKNTTVDREIPIYNNYPNSSLWSCKALSYKEGYLKQNIRYEPAIFGDINDKYIFLGDLQHKHLWPCNELR